MAAWKKALMLLEKLIQFLNKLQVFKLPPLLRERHCGYQENCQQNFPESKQFKLKLCAFQFVQISCLLY